MYIPSHVSTSIALASVHTHVSPGSSTRGVSFTSARGFVSDVLLWTTSVDLDTTVQMKSTHEFTEQIVLQS